MQYNICIALNFIAANIYLLSIIDHAAGELRRTVAADRLVEVDPCRRQEGEERQHEDGVLAAELVGERVGAAELRVLNVAGEPEQALHYDDDRRSAGSPGPTPPPRNRPPSSDEIRGARDQIVTGDRALFSIRTQRRVERYRRRCLCRETNVAPHVQARITRTYAHLTGVR